MVISKSVLIKRNVYLKICFAFLNNGIYFLNNFTQHYKITTEMAFSLEYIQVGISASLPERVSLTTGTS